MSKLSLGALVAIVVGVGTALYVANNSSEPATDVTTNATQPVTESTETEDSDSVPVAGVGTLADFFGRGDSVYCTFTNEYEGGTSNGEFWYSNEQMRVEATTRTDGEVYTSNMINDGQRTYVWGGTAAGVQAMVFNNELTETSAAEMATFETGQADARVDIEQAVSYECEAWRADATQFTPPRDIEFIDMAAMMQGMFEGELRGMPEGMNF